MPYRTSTALLSLLLTLAAWGLVGLFARTISADEARRATGIEDAQRLIVANAATVRTHALVLDSAQEGSELKAFLDVDIVSAAYMIEAVGKVTGVTIKLGDAQPESMPAAEVAAPRVIGFVVAADGRFSALMRAAQLFETLPIPSSVTRLDIEHAPETSGNASDLWHMSVYIRVLTTTDISS